MTVNTIEQQEFSASRLPAIWASVSRQVRIHRRTRAIAAAAVLGIAVSLLGTGAALAILQPEWLRKAFGIETLETDGLTWIDDPGAVRQLEFSQALAPYLTDLPFDIIGIAAHEDSHRHEVAILVTRPLNEHEVAALQATVHRAFPDAIVHVVVDPARATCVPATLEAGAPCRPLPLDFTL